MLYLKLEDINVLKFDFLKDDNTAEYWKNINSKLFFGNEIQSYEKIENERKSVFENDPPAAKKIKTSGWSISD